MSFPAEDVDLACDGRWSPAFRAWLDAYYYSAGPEPLVRELDLLAQTEGQRLKRAATLRQVCSECGRTF
jgi:hypothetical protein